MRLIEYLTARANMPFTVALGVAASVALLQASGALSLLADDHDVDHDVDHDHDVEHDSDHPSLLGFLGVGRIPFSLAWQTGAIGFGIVGLALNVRHLGDAAVPLLTLAWTLPLSLVAGAGSVAAAARLLGPLFRPAEATSRNALVGRSAVVISSRITSDFGEVRVRDDHGHDVRLICRLADGAAEPREGSAVVIVDVDDGGKPVVAPV